MDKNSQLVSYAYYYQGNWSKIAHALAMQEEVPIIKPKESYVTIYDSFYPECFRELRFPPWVIFYEGNIEILQKECVAIVGSRNSTLYGEEATKWIVSNLKDRYGFVSGLAKGIDGIVHQSAIEQGAYTIGIIGSGLGTCYPSCNQWLYDIMREKHLILSEYPWYAPVRREHFPWRNRLIAALGKALFVSQAKLKSGTMLTVNEALALSKDIYCIPYEILDKEGEGCNYLIQQGASILYETNQFLLI